MQTTVTLLDNQKGKPLQQPHTVYIQRQNQGISERVQVPSSVVSQELFRARGNWMFDFIPDELIITEKLVTVKNNYFPFGSFVSSVSIENIRLVEVSHSFIFSTIYIKGVSEKVVMTFKWLTRRAAQKAKDIIDGLRIVRHDDITLSSNNRADIANTLAEIGRND